MRLSKFLRLGLIIGLILTDVQPLSAISLSDFYSTNNINFYNNAAANCDTSAAGGNGDMPYELPASQGKAGREESIDASGQVPSGGRVTFAAHAALGQEYRDYYITMRWRYTKWNWSGTNSGVDNAHFKWLADQPRIVLVTNPRTNKSIFAVALEAGPAPWTGVDTSPNNQPKQGWSNPQDGTPDGYTGRVAGFPPKAFDYLEIQQGMYNGSGDQLSYQWAADQSVKPGVADVTASGSNCTGDSNPNIDGYVFPLGSKQNGGAIKKSEVTAWDNAKTNANLCSKTTPPYCHHDNTGALDITSVQAYRGNYTDAIDRPIYALTDGKIYSIKNRHGDSRCNDIQFQASDGWFYWYGHMSAWSQSNHQVGDTLKAGDKLGQVGISFCADGTTPHLHIDRGSPKGQLGGRVGNRDGTDFIKLINKLYAGLPQ